MKKLFLVLTIVLLAPSVVSASNPDMAIGQSDIRFSSDDFVAGETVRIYARVRNVGDTDITGYIAFYSGSDLIDSSQVATLVADGANEEVWVDYVIPYAQSFNVRAVIKGTSPQDINPSNDEILTPLYSIITDDDGDGVSDDSDNCIGISNPSQIDSDSDGLGDSCDNDDDNDGLSDDVEYEIGTDPTDIDTDNDGYTDADDKYPLDSSKHEEEQIIELILTTPQEEYYGQDSDDSGNQQYSSDEQMFDDNDEVEQDADLSDILSTSILHVSPKASFVYSRDGWKTYSFESLVYESTYKSLLWDFGDNASSTDKIVSHEYDGPGVYAVRLIVTDNDGNSYEDTQEIYISFFHFSNPMVQVVLGILAVLMIVSAVMILKTKTAGEIKNVSKKKREQT
jgi:ABC-type antimicrobial peptide transport system permease subunit